MPTHFTKLRGSGRRALRRARAGLGSSYLDTKNALSSRADGMFTAAKTRRYGTRRRAVLPMVGGVVALGTMFNLVSSNVLAVSFTSSNQAYKVYTDRVVGQYAAGFINAQQKQSGPTAVAQIGFKQADLFGMCVIAPQDLPVLGTVSLLMTGGEPVNGTVTDPAKKINANELYVASNSLKGSGENISRMTLGQSADTLAMDNIVSHRGAPGAFGLQAQLMQIGNLDADSYGIDLQGSINIPDLNIRVVPGVATKANC